VGDVRIRPMADGDEHEVAALLAADASPVWANQGHALHGPAWREGRRWRQTWVAERAGHVIGAATVATNRVHDGRLLCAVEVAEQRRRGLGSMLLTAARQGAPDPRPFAAKVAPGSPGHHFVNASGGGTYQRCDGATLDPSSAEVQAWSAGVGVPDGALVGSLEGWARERLVAGFAKQYLWLHGQWAPVTSVDALVDVARSTIDEHDAALGSASVIDDRLAALVLAFPLATSGSRWWPKPRAGTSRTATCCSRRPWRNVRAAAATGVMTIELDGHVIDPHLHPMLQGAPRYATNPLLLVELPS